MNTSTRLLSRFACALLFTTMGTGCDFLTSTPQDPADMMDGGGTDMMTGADMDTSSDAGLDDMMRADGGMEPDSGGPATPKDFDWNGGARAVDVQAGNDFACALFDQGGVKCWGGSEHGIRGSEALGIPEQPTVFPGYGSGVAELAVGAEHACVRLDDGVVECWGRNIAAQLTGVRNERQGDVPNPTPLRVEGLGQVTKLAAGGAHTCALRADGRVACWGSSLNGAIGHDEIGGVGDDDSYVQPTFAQGFNGKVVDIEPHDFGTCALIDTGEVECWGGNLGSLRLNAYALRAPGLAGEVTEIFGGAVANAMCALRGGEAVCIGSNGSGQLGVGDRDYREFAVPALDLPSGQVVGMAPGTTSICWLMDSGEVYCSGNGDNGQLGNGGTDRIAFPAQVEGLTGKAVQITAGRNFHCALMDDGGVMCWGAGGALGNDEESADQDEAVAVAGLDTTELTPGYMENPEPFDPGMTDALDPSKPDPLAWQGGTKVVSISSGDSHSCALFDGGGVRCWGASGEEALGEYVGGMAPPVEIPELGSGGKALSVGNRASCVLQDEEVVCWGSNLSGSLGQEITGTSVGRPKRVPLLGSGVQDIYLAAGLGCAIYADNVKCWGDNKDGKVGTGEEDPSDPVRATDVSFAGPVTKIASSNLLRFALLADGTVQTWGPEAFGGMATLAPVAVEGLSGVTDLDVGNNHWCVIEAGTVRCAGTNSSGHLGDGTTETSVDALVEAQGITGTPELIACGESFTCVAVSEGGVQCVGRHVRDGNSNPEWAAVPGLHADGTIIELTATSTFACALFDDGRVQCFGENLDRELGVLDDTARSFEARDVYGL